METIAQALLLNLKYIINLSSSRVLIHFEQHTVVIETNKGRIRVAKNEQEVSGIESETFISRIPKQFGPEDIQEDMAQSPEIFKDPGLTYLYYYPIVVNEQQKILVAIGNKENSPYNEVDFRFIKLIGEFLLNKVGQMLIVENLENIVAERTKKLLETNKELNTLFYRSSHDFRRPLSSISGLLNLARAMDSKEELSKIYGHCDEIIFAFNAMLQKLSDLTGLEEDNAQFEETDIRKLFEGVCEGFATELGKINIKTRFYIPPGLQVSIHEQAISIIFHHLVDNAIKFSIPHLENKHLIFGAKKAQGKTILWLEDNGTGIPEEIQPNVFDMYYIGNPSSKGNGLGLYVVKKLVQKLKGHVAIQSENGKGTSVQILLPTV